MDITTNGNSMSSPWIFDLVSCGVLSDCFSANLICSFFCKLKQLLEFLFDFLVFLFGSARSGFFQQLDPDVRERFEKADFGPDLETLFDAQQKAFPSIATWGNASSLKMEGQKNFWRYLLLAVPTEN